MASTQRFGWRPRSLTASAVFFSCFIRGRTRVEDWQTHCIYSRHANLFIHSTSVHFIHFIHPCTYSSRERDFYSLWGSTPTRRICRNPGVAFVEFTTDITMETTMDTDDSPHPLDHLTCHNHTVPVSDIIKIKEKRKKKDGEMPPRLG